MTYNIIKTENYLLVVDDSEIKEGDIVLETYVDGTNGLEQIDTLNDIHPLVHKKILAHLPLSANNLKNIPLLPPLQEDEYEKSISESCNKSISNILMIGYKKAKEKYKYTEEDLRKIFSRGWELRERYNGSDRNGYEENYPSNWKDMDYEERQEWFYEQELKSLTKYPIGFKFKMETKFEWVGNYIY